MDDDLGEFGASVWLTSGTASSSKLKQTEDQDTFAPSSSTATSFSPADDFDDFSGDFQASNDQNGFDDDFGDFEEFPDPAQANGSASFVSERFEEGGLDFEAPSLSREQWKALVLEPFPSTAKLKQDIEGLLGPLFDSDDSPCFTEEEIRQVEGLNQVLVTQESRALYNTLFHSTQNLKTPNWIRSRIRRQHLVSLGIPVNLDEVLPQANGKALPALQITTRPSSAPPGHRNNSRHSLHSAHNSRSTTPRQSPQVPSAASSFGPQPELDQGRIAKLLALNSDNLSLQPLATLESHLTSLRSITANATTVLTHLLQTRDSLQQNSETYNRLIAELVGEAQRMTLGPKSRTGMGKRGSGAL